MYSGDVIIMIKNYCVIACVELMLSTCRPVSQIWMAMHLQQSQQLSANCWLWWACQVSDSYYISWSYR